jgi:hypothetical protein
LGLTNFIIWQPSGLKKGQRETEDLDLIALRVQKFATWQRRGLKFKMCSGSEIEIIQETQPVTAQRCL